MLVNKRRGFNLDYGKVEQFGEVFELEQEFNYKCLILCENKLFEKRVGKRDKFGKKLNFPSDWRYLLEKGENVPAENWNPEAFEVNVEVLPTSLQHS